MKKLNSLSKILSRKGLERESWATLDLLKIARTDEDLEAIHNYNSLPTSEKRKILSNMSIYKTLTPEQRSDIAHSVLDAAGLAPGPGDVADVINAILYANEGRYALAALSLIFLVPIIGSALGAGKLAKRILPAKIIFEHADEIERVVAKITPEIPNGNLVKEAVDHIIENARVGIDISLDTGEPVVSSVSRTVKEEASKIIDSKNAWYLNPKWQEWFSSIMRPSLTTVFNGITEREFRTRLMKGAYNKAALDKLKSEIAEWGVDELSRSRAARVIEGNSELIKRISESIPRLVEELKSTMKIEFITSLNKIPADSAGVFGKFNPGTNTISIYLPNFSKYIANPSGLIEELQTTLKHEVWHAIDSKIVKALHGTDYGGPISGYMLSESTTSVNTGFKSIFDSLKSIFKYDGMSESGIKYLKDNSEIYVRIKSLREFVKKTFKKNLEYSDLLTLVRDIDNSKYSIPGDAKQILELLKNCSDDEIKDAALLIDKVP